MRKHTRKVLGYIALALVCVFAGTVIGTAHPMATAEEKVVLTSPFTAAIAAASAFGLVGSIALIIMGDVSGIHVSEKQPMKMATIEGIWETEPAPMYMGE